MFGCSSLRMMATSDSRLSTCFLFTAMRSRLMLLMATSAPVSRCTARNTFANEPDLCRRGTRSAARSAGRSVPAQEHHTSNAPSLTQYGGQTCSHPPSAALRCLRRERLCSRATGALASVVGPVSRQLPPTRLRHDRFLWRKRRALGKTRYAMQTGTQVNPAMASRVSHGPPARGRRRAIDR
jgi:hypothetical protein